MKPYLKITKILKKQMEAVNSRGRIIAEFQQQTRHKRNKIKVQHTIDNQKYSSSFTS